MSKFLIYVEDRAETDDHLFSVNADSMDEAQNKFVKAYVPYIKEIDWNSLQEMLAGIDIYIHIVAYDNVEKL